MKLSKYLDLIMLQTKKEHIFAKWTCERYKPRKPLNNKSILIDFWGQKGTSQLYPVATFEGAKKGDFGNQFFLLRGEGLTRKEMEG